jgi:hypothetical protein
MLLGNRANHTEGCPPPPQGPQSLCLTPSASAPSDNPSVNQHDRDGPRSHERGHRCGFCERTAVECHAHRQKEHAQKARAKDRSWSWEIVHCPAG